MKKQRFFILILLVALVLAILAGFFLPIIEDVDIQIYGYEIDHDGNPLREGTIVLQGKQLNFLLREDRFVFSDMSIFDISVLELTDVPTRYHSGKTSHLGLQYDVLTAGVTTTVAAEASIYSLRAAIGTDKQWCYIALDDTFSNEGYRFIAYTQNGVEDANELIEKCTALFD